MIAASLLALVGIALLAAGTPRQADLLFRAKLAEPSRRALRLAGLVLLAFSLGAALAGDDRARAFIGWVGVIGMEALAFALAFSWIAGRRSAR